MDLYGQDKGTEHDGFRCPFVFLFAFSPAGLFGEAPVMGRSP